MNLETIAAEMSDISEKLVVSGMVHLMGGNFSVREGDRMAITGHFSAKRALHAEDLFLAGVDDDEPVEGASATLDMHRAIFRKTDAAAIVHAHPYHATLLSYYTDVICLYRRHLPDRREQYLLPWREGALRPRCRLHEVGSAR